MNVTTAGLILILRQGLILLVLLSAPPIIGTAILVAAPLSHELSSHDLSQNLSQTAAQPFGEELAVKGEVVMIEGNVQIVERPSDGKKDVQMIMDHLYVAKVAGDEAIRFHINEKTRLDKDLKIGDRVEVLAAQNGEALSIKKSE
jgi:hypothetical protein